MYKKVYFPFTIIICLFIMILPLSFIGMGTYEIFFAEEIIDYIFGTLFIFIGCLACIAISYFLVPEFLGAVILDDKGIKTSFAKKTRKQISWNELQFVQLQPSGIVFSRIALLKGVRLSKKERREFIKQQIYFFNDSKKLKVLAMFKDKFVDKLTCSYNLSIQQKEIYEKILEMKFN